MKDDNGDDIAQHIASNGTGHQYNGRVQQIVSGSGTIINNNALDSSRDEILQALYTSPYLQRKNRNPDRVPGTCEWFMGHDDFHHWQDSKSSSMLWVSANPGCGKSVLAKYLVDELETTELRTTCYFFFKDDFEDQRSAKSALSCILHQLFTQKENLFSDKIAKRFRSYKSPLANSYYELWQLWDILTMAAQEKNAGEIICILDAFDECREEERQDLAKIVREFYGPKSETKENVNLNFLLTSRPYDTIRRNLIDLFNIQEIPVIHLKGDGDVEVEKIAGEISLYIKDRVSRVRVDLGLTQKEEMILLQGLGAIHNQTYLWVHLTLEWIETEIRNEINETKIRNVISTLPRTVDEAYDKILSKSTDMNQTKKLLHIVVAAERPLTLAEMDLALALRQHHRSYEDLGPRPPSDRFRKYIRDLCGLFVNITDGKVYLLHQTAKEFLVPRINLDSQEKGPERREDDFQADKRNQLTWKCLLQPSQSHNILFKICAWYLLFAELETRPLTAQGNITDYLGNNVFLEYSAKHWATHFRASDIEEDEVIEQLQLLCDSTSRRFLTWFKIYWMGMHTDLDFPSNFTTIMAASYFGLESIVRLQLRVPDVEIDFVDSTHRRSALSWASENGFEGIVKLLIKGPKFQLRKALKKGIRQSFKGAEVDIRDKIQRTPLSYASWNGHLSVVQRLVRAGARADSKDEIGGTPISYALCTGQQDIATELKKGTQANSIDDIRNTLLISAITNGHEAIVKRLLDSGANIEAKNQDGITPLTLAVINGHEVIIKLLLNRGANIEAKNRDDITPLTFAVIKGHEVIVKYLLDSGADINAKGQWGRTPLSFAIIHSRKTIVKRLLDSGANLEAKDNNGMTPLILAVIKGYKVIVKLLLDKGANIEAKDQDGITPLILAVIKGYEGIVKHLLDSGANIKAKGQWGRMPLGTAVIYGHEAIVKRLLDSGADIEAKDNDGMTPLILAVREGHEVIMKYLLNSGADTEAKDNDGKTPLTIATEYGTMAVVQLLLEKGG